MQLGPPLSRRRVRIISSYSYSCRMNWGFPVIQRSLCIESSDTDSPPLGSAARDPSMKISVRDPSKIDSALTAIDRGQPEQPPSVSQATLEHLAQPKESQAEAARV
ncbi:hypothetical protein QAD02_017318 [Eretmocerus hayati]|uniref:Uncharacterized protein n=1 Tax=Eretmocerus hayati TaxID=131215 RepID=A0ACC2PEU5_9HYME|nr:hypothetical protein QAD02_017318 [Eretmocerus hayati]